jgi:hypothetical protein
VMARRRSIDESCTYGCRPWYTYTCIRYKEWAGVGVCDSGCHELACIQS